MLGKLLAGKALAAVAVIGLTASGAAAATGSLPDPAQGAVAGALSHVGVNVPHPNHGKSADHRKDGGDHGQPGDDEGQPGDNSQPDNHGQDTSTAAHDARDTAKDAGQKVGPAVCKAVTDGKCQAGQHGQPGGSDDHGTPSSDDHGGQSGEQGESGDDHGTTPTTGSIQTGEDHSGRELPSSDEGKGGSH